MVLEKSSFIALIVLENIYILNPPDCLENIFFKKNQFLVLTELRKTLLIKSTLTDVIVLEEMLLECP